jgi:ABC-type transport system involved in cytochrome c biogenesis ATPase subunit
MTPRFASSPERGTSRPMSTAVLIGGANGAGKTTFARSLVPLLHPGAAFLNLAAREGYAPLAARS